VIASRLVGESLSVAIHNPSRTVLATHPDANLITFWSMDGGSLIGKLEVPGPRGVTLTLDEKLFVVSYGTEARLLFIQPHPIQALPARHFAPGVF
jgi:hypothetical protein